MLLDVGTPFVRRHGTHRLDARVVVSPAPPGSGPSCCTSSPTPTRTTTSSRGPWRWTCSGNFHKEGAAHRIDIGLAVVNQWLATADVPGPRDPIRRTEVAEYYRRDARLLALFLHARRADRAIRTRVLRQRYDFLLPGKVTR